jgi:hypothetical protein
MPQELFIGELHICSVVLSCYDFIRSAVARYKLQLKGPFYACQRLGRLASWGLPSGIGLGGAGRPTGTGLGGVTGGQDSDDKLDEDERGSLPDLRAGP